MEGNVECRCRCWYDSAPPMPCCSSMWLTALALGPAHAVYFATYEAVKHLMGGNKAGEHHPLAAGKLRPLTCAYIMVPRVDC